MATDLETLVVSLGANIKQYENAMNRASGIMNKQAREIERRGATMQKRLDGIGKSAANSLIAPLTGIGAALGVREIANYADAWTLAGNKIRAAATASDVQVRSLDDLKNSANAARTDLVGYVDLYAKLIRNASGVAKSEQEIAVATDVVAKAFKVGGANANEQAAGILQLGQALGSGILQGDELRSIRENAPVIAKALATEMGVSIAQLKELGAQGKITSEIVFRALIKAQAEVERQFRSTNATIKDGLTAVNNEFLAYIGNADASSGASRGLVTALQALTTNFGTVADSVVVFATLIIGALTGRAIVGLVGGIGTAITALGALLTALRTGTAVAATFTAALGPIGILAGVAAAALLILANRSEEADKAAEAHRKTIVELKDAFALAQRGVPGAVAAFQSLAQAHVAGAEAALAHAKTELEVLAAVQAARAAFPQGNFGEAAALSANEDSFQDAAFAKATAAVAERTKEVEKLKAALANPEKVLVEPTDTGGFGAGTGAAASTGGKAAKRTASDRFNADIQATKDRTAALAEEQAMIGQGLAVQEARRVALGLEQAALYDLREEARKKGETDLASIALAPEQIAKIKEVADAYGDQSAALQRAQQAFGDINDLGRDALGGFISDIREGVSATEALSNALDGVVDKLLDMALNSLFDTGGGGGLLSSLFGGLASGGVVQKLAEGGPSGRVSGPGTGTSDSIPTMLSNGEFVVRASQAKKHMSLLHALNSGRITKMATGGAVGGGTAAPARSGNGGSSLPITVVVEGARGNTEIQQMVRAGVQQGLGQYDKRLPGRIQDIQYRGA